MTEAQMVSALKSVGACFATSTAKFVAPTDPIGAKPTYHIHPDAANPRQEDIIRVHSGAQLLDWVRTAKAVQRTTNEIGFDLWQAYEDRWLARTGK